MDIAGRLRSLWKQPFEVNGKMAGLEPNAMECLRNEEVEEPEESEAHLEPVASDMWAFCTSTNEMCDGGVYQTLLPA